MKSVAFAYADTYIQSIEAFCSTVNVLDVEFHDSYLVVKYE